MVAKASEGVRGLPERLVGLVRARLKKHLLWDSLLIFLPPVLVCAYFAGFFYQSAWIPREIVIFASLLLAGIASLIGLLRHRRLVPSVSLAAKLIDGRAEAQDRFLTLATLDPSAAPSSLVSRLRREAAGLLHRIDLKKDFPYRLKRSCIVSWISSVVLLLLFQSILQFGFLSEPEASPAKDLVFLARKLSPIAPYAELARDLEEMARRLERPDLSARERQSLVRELLKKVDEQLSAAQQEASAGSELLSGAAERLRQLDREQGQGKDQKAGGGVKTDLPEEGEGKGKESGKGETGEGRDPSARLGQGNKGEGSPQREKTRERGQGEEKRGDGTRSKGDEKGGEGKGREEGSLAKGAFEEKGGRGKTQEAATGTPPERFFRPGEQGEKGIKDARFVTVQLPEEDFAGSAGEGGTGKRKTPRAKVPVSNVPLRPPASPESPSEKQRLPLEYRGLIR